MIQSLSKTIDLPSDEIIELDALRKQRNIADYSGDLVTNIAMSASLQWASRVLLKVEDNLREQHGELFK